MQSVDTAFFSTSQITMIVMTITILYCIPIKSPI
jgi:hypothetical protein